MAVGYGQHAEAAADTAAQILAAGGRAAAVSADLGDPAGPGDLVKAAEDALGPVDVLVSNAGMGGTKALAEVTAADFDTRFRPAGWDSRTRSRTWPWPSWATPASPTR